ncbi:MAG: energy transducer TonB [Rhodobacteraceae bacterium]|nr:energy transducer TonB [Paracoccaceae bacterium]
MQTGTAISGIAHLTLIGWVILKGVFSVDPDPVQVSEVALVSAEEYAALTAPVQAPELPETVGVPEDLAQPETPGEDAPPEVAEDPVPERLEPTPPAPPEPAPQTPPVPEPPQPPTPEIAEQPPEITAPPEPPAEDTAALAPTEAQRPAPRPVDRQAAAPADPPPPDARPDPVTEAPVAPEGRDEVAPEADTAAAPEEATDTPPDPQADPQPDPEPAPEPAEDPADTVETAAQPAPVSGAPTASVRPATRPQRPSTPAQTAQPTQTAQPQSETDAPSSDISQSVNDAVAAALGAAGAGAPAPSGPPLTGGEQEALRVAVSQCWSVGPLSSAALATTVVVGVSMTPDGRPVTNSIRLVSWSGGADSAAQQAFDAARRAIIRCGQQGYPLPADKYEQWRDIEMTFNPEKMQYR